jgi:hypothetical protein
MSQKILLEQRKTRVFVGRFSTRLSSLDSNLNFERTPVKLQEKKRERKKRKEKGYCPST